MKGQYSVPSSTFASNNLYVGGQPQSHPASNDLYVGGQSQSHPASNKLYVGGQSQRQDYGGPVWASAGTFQAVPSAGSQLVNPTNYSGPTYNPNDFNNASRYDPVGSISSQLANTTLSGSPGLRDPASLASNRLVSANNPKEQTERLDPRKLLDLNYHLFLLVTEIDRISCY